MNELVRFLSRAALWQVVGRLLRRAPWPVVALVGVVAVIGFLATAR